MKMRFVIPFLMALACLRPGGLNAAGNEGAEPQVIRVAVYVLNLGRLDMATGEFSIDMYLSLKSDSEVPDNCLEFLNGRASNVDKIVDKPNEKFYRVLAGLRTPIDLHRYPFDRQKMQVVLEHKTRTAAEVVLQPVPAESGIDAAISFPGWQLTGTEMAARDHDYPVYGETYSQFVFGMNIARMRLNAFLKTFLPVIFLMLIVLSSFILNPEQVGTRLAAISSSLIASAMFHISISGQIPPLGYLTFADKFMLLTYLILLGGFFLSIAVFILQNKEATKPTALKLNRVSEILVLVCMPLLYACLFLFVR